MFVDWAGVEPLIQGRGSKTQHKQQVTETLGIRWFLGDVNIEVQVPQIFNIFFQLHVY